MITEINFKILIPDSLPNQAQIEHIFNNEKSWEGRYKQLILLGKQLPSIDTSLKNSSNELTGCEAKVWIGVNLKSAIKAKLGDDIEVELYAESESRIINGLLSLVLIFFNNQTITSITTLNEHDATQWLHQLGISDNLTATRKTGVASMQARIKNLISTLLSHSES